MKSQPNASFDFVLALMSRLIQAQIMIWLCGGWAEELWGISLPSKHRDVDLLYPAPGFAYLDQWLAQAANLVVIPQKKFSHKRAILLEGMMVEVILLESEKTGGYVTNFFDGRYQLIWPRDTLHLLSLGELKIPVASKEALHLYRNHQPHIANAYQMYLQEPLE
jgi:hypothetical protein